MAIRFDEIELSSSGNVYYPVISGVASAQYLKIKTSHGYLHLGANNSSYAHFYTDRGAYYFNTVVKFDGSIAGYGGDETAQFASFIDSNDTNYYVNPASGSVLGGTVTIHNDGDSSVSIQNAGTNAVGIYAHSGDELYLGSNNQSIVRLHSGGTMELTVADTFYKYDGDKYARGFKTYQYYAGGGGYYSGGNAGWTKVATVTVTGNCAGANLFGKLYQRNYHDVAIINVAFVLRAECDFTSNNESHFMENASTFAATSYHTDIDSSVRAVLTASSTNSRTYEIQFYEFAWNDNWYELWTTGFSVLDTPAAPTASTGTARLNNNSYGAAKVYYGTASVRSPIFYDLNNTNYYTDPAGTSQVNSIEFVGSTNNAKIGQPVSTEWGTRITTDSGYILFGPANTSHAHIYTDRSNFYFNKQIQLLGGSLINQNDIRAKIFYDLDDAAYYLNPAGTSNLNDVEIVQLAIDGYIYHKGDTDTYLGFSGANSMKFVAGGTERMAITGDVHVQGTTDLNINGTSRRINFTSGTGTIRTTSANNLIFQTNSTTRFTISNSGTVTATADVVAYSDERLKTDIKTLDGSKVYDMRGVSFTKDDKQGSGVIAQELEKVAPELVNNESEYKSVAYGNLTGYLIEAIKDLKAEIEELKKHSCDCKK